MNNPAARPLLAALALLLAAFPSRLAAQPPDDEGGDAGAAPSAPAASTVAAVAEIPAIVKVNATLQPYQPLRPWMKTPPIDRRGLGVALGAAGVLVSAEMVSDATYVELEKAVSGEKCPASVSAVDYSANLALVKPSDEKFLAGIEPLTLREAAAGDKVSVCQIERTGVVLKTEGVMTTLEVDRYPAEDLSLLVGRVACSLQFREGSFALPVLFGKGLAGIMMRYNPRNQNAEVIPVPVIRHFLEEAKSGDYRGFPRLGIGFSPLRDPQFRAWANVPDTIQGGVYIQSVEPGSPAEKAGFAVGDVLLEVAGRKIDRDGNYRDERHGQLGLSHLVSTLHRDGESLSCGLLRAGKPLKLSVPLVARLASAQIIPPYLYDVRPRYRILGGLVFLELSKPYLQQWRDWKKNGPRRFVYFEEFQSELFAGDERDRIVVLAQVIPGEATVGFEDLSQLTVAAVNGIRPKNLAHMEDAIAAVKDGMHRIEFEEDPRLIFLDATQASAAEVAIQKAYGIRELKRLD